MSYAAEVKVGDKIGDFKLQEALGDNVYSLSSPEYAGSCFIYFIMWSLCVLCGRDKSGGQIR